MTIRMTESTTFNKPGGNLPPLREAERQVERTQENQAHSSSALSINSRNRKRIPQILLTALRQVNKQNTDENLDAKKSRVGGMVASSFNSIRNKLWRKRACQICEDEIHDPTEKKFKQVYMCDCEHKFNFCESCLHHYVIYKVKNFEEVNCPREGCPKTLDMNTQFFKNLPADIQRNYKKISQFQMITKDPEAKLCPRQNCQGVIRGTGTENVLVCNECSKEYCSKCLLGVHAGDCDKQEVQFFQNNLHYRQCKKCKIVVEKIQGCNHITCRCKYQFCYVCGAPWTVEHYGNHDENGRLLAVPDPGRRAPAQHYYGGGGGGDDGCCEDCCDGCQFNNCCGVILCLPVKFLILIFFLAGMLLMFAFRDLLVIVIMFCVTIFAGMTGFACQILGELEGFMALLGLLFFPVLMILGIIKAFPQVFCETVGPMMSEYCQNFCTGLENICNND